MKNITSKEIMATLLNDPDRVKFRELLKNHTGESDELEFKGDYIEKEKLAKHILAMANFGGGLIIFGIEEKEGKLTPKGLENIQDKTDIGNQLSPYLPHELEYDIYDFTYGDATEWDKIKNKDFQMILINPNLEHIPFLCKKEGTNLKQNIIYFRRNSSSDIINYEELQELLNKRINNSLNHDQKDLTIDLEQLELLTSYFSIHKKPFYSLTNPLFLSIVQKLSKQKIDIIKEKMK